MDKLESWGMSVRGTCYNCQMEVETRDHLFFGYSYAKDVWKQVLQLYGMSTEVRS